MSSKSEVGHNKNVANFSAAYTILEEMGTLYNPTNTRITLESLTPIQATLVADITRLDNAMAAYRASVAEKENAINQMDKKATRIGNYFYSLNVPDNEKENIASQIRNIRGDSRKAPKNPEEEENNSISTSHQSFDSKVANFNTLIAQLEAFPEYVPNETEITIASLQSYTEELNALRNANRTAADALISARAARNNTLYYNDPNVIGLIKNIKAYVKSLGQPGEPYYKALVRLKFTNINP